MPLNFPAFLIDVDTFTKENAFNLCRELKEANSNRNEVRFQYYLMSAPERKFDDLESLENIYMEHGCRFIESIEGGRKVSHYRKMIFEKKMLLDSEQLYKDILFFKEVAREFGYWLTEIEPEW